jgi:hypothetical protein
MVGRLARFVHGEQTGTIAPHRVSGLKRGYARRRNSAARTRSRNCSGVSVGSAGAGFGFTTAGAAGFSAFFAA